MSVVAQQVFGPEELLSAIAETPAPYLLEATAAETTSSQHRCSRKRCGHAAYPSRGTASSPHLEDAFENLLDIRGDTPKLRHKMFVGVEHCVAIRHTVGLSVGVEQKSSTELVQHVKNMQSIVHVVT